MRRLRQSWPLTLTLETWECKLAVLATVKDRKLQCKGESFKQPMPRRFCSHHLSDDTDEQSRIILDASTRRFQAHKIYLRAAAATRWAQMRQQILRDEKPNGRHANALRAIDQRLRDVSTLPSHCGVPLHTCDARAGIKNSKDRQGYMWLMNVTIAGAFSYNG